MLVARIDDTLRFSYRDRSVREAFRFSVPTDGRIANANVIVRGEAIVAYAIITPRGGATTFAPRVEVVGLDLRGAQRFRREIPFAYEGWGSSYRLVGNADGLAVLTLLEVRAKVGVVMQGTAVDTFVPTLGAEADPDSGGRVLCNAYAGANQSPYQFFDPRTRQLATSRYGEDLLAGRSTSSAVPLGTGLAYLRHDPPRLVVEDADGARDTAPLVELSAEERAHDPAWASGEWALFHLRAGDQSAGRFLAARPSTGERRTLRLALPAPWTPEGQLGSYPRIDGGGHVLVAATDGERDRLFATRDGIEWKTRGNAVAHGGYPFPHTFAEAGGAVVFRGFGSASPTKPQGALDASTLQYVGPQGGSGVALARQTAGGADNPTYADPVLSEDGKCLAYFRDGSLQAAQAATYEVGDLGLVATTDSAEMAWIPEAGVP